jgi:hypothetical protein
MREVVGSSPGLDFALNRYREEGLDSVIDTDRRISNLHYLKITTMKSSLEML